MRIATSPSKPRFVLAIGGSTHGKEPSLAGDDFRRYPKLEMPENPDEGLLVQDHGLANTIIPGYTD